MLNIEHRIDVCPVICILWLTFSLAACSGASRQLTCLHNARTDSLYEADFPMPHYVIQPNDLLYVHISGDNQVSAEFLNVGQSSGGGGNLPELMAFLIDERGIISHPRLGELSVAGKTLPDIRKTVRKSVSCYLDSAFIDIRLLNRTCTVLGEVRSPGLQQMPKGYFTIFEALGSAGDITVSGNRTRLKRLRETPEGKQISNIDLTSPDLLASDLYYVLPNDVIYVEPNQFRRYSSSALPWISQASVGASLVTSLFLLLNLFK